jgi:glycerophosphoryl diester phosphodiesterase
MRSWLIIYSLALLVGCKEYEPQLGNILLFGHGGGGFDNVNSKFAPNSVAAMQSSLEVYGLDGIEVDVQFTKDRDLVVFHDVFLENATQCKGKLSKVNMAEIAGCFYRDEFKNTYRQQVITLDSLITLMNTVWIDKYLSLNLQATFHKKMRGFVSLEKVNVECSNANFLYYLEQQDSTYKSYLTADISKITVEDVFRFKFDGIVSSFDTRDYELEKKLVDGGKVIFLYGAKIPSDYRGYRYDHITGVQVDNPILALKYFRNQ